MAVFSMQNGSQIYSLTEAESYAIIGENMQKQVIYYEKSTFLTAGCGNGFLHGRLRFRTC